MKIIFALNNSLKIPAQTVFEQNKRNKQFPGKIITKSNNIIKNKKKSNYKKQNDSLLNNNDIDNDNNAFVLDIGKNEKKPNLKKEHTFNNYTTNTNPKSNDIELKRNKVISKSNSDHDNDLYQNVDMILNKNENIIKNNEINYNVISTKNVDSNGETKQPENSKTKIESSNIISGYRQTKFSSYKKFNTTFKEEM